MPINQPVWWDGAGVFFTFFHGSFWVLSWILLLHFIYIISIEGAPQQNSVIVQSGWCIFQDNLITVQNSVANLIWQSQTLEVEIWYVHVMIVHSPHSTRPLFSALLTATCFLPGSARGRARFGTDFRVRTWSSTNLISISVEIIGSC